MKLGELVNTAVVQKRQADAAQMADALGTHVVATAAREVGGQHDAVNMAFLVDRRQQFEFKQALEGLAEHWADRIQLRLPGPLRRTTSCRRADMGRLTGILTWPVAPVRGVVWVADQIKQEAERQYYDPPVIQREISEVDEAHEDGDLTEKQRDELQEQLLNRLFAAQQRRRTMEV